ncbi:MAG: dienelactone hydrolase family protein [Proteobacteria bacterium]|nr:dienelactone hydrolase family protein [Pseudomonadota bacterium]
MNKALTATLFVLAFARAVTVAAEVRVETTSWTNHRDGTEVPAYFFHDASQARADGTLPAVLFIPGRRGLQEVDRKYVAEIAAGGFLILAPDWQTARFIEPMPVSHDPATELDVALGLAHIKAHPRARPGEKRVLYGYSRGGYYAVRIAAGAIDPAHRDEVACIVTISGHFQNPNAPEPAQVFGMMPELDRLAAPILMIIGTEDIGLRVDNNARAFYALINRGHKADLMLLPGARRAFDLREYLEESTYTPAERTAKRYSMMRAAQFMRGCFG